VDALLAAGVSLGRIAAPFVPLGVGLTLVRLVLYGFVQPYTRYGYRAVMHAAQNSGWNGVVPPMALLSPDGKFVLTTEGSDPTGQRLDRVFVRQVSPDGGEVVLTAASAEVHRTNDNRSVILELRDGQQLTTTPELGTGVLTFSSLALRLPLAPAAKLLRGRGSEENELTLFELARLALGPEPPALPRQTLLAELYSRLARALALPLMPLLAVPLGLTAKRAGSTPAMLIAGLILFGFQTSLVFAQGLVGSGTVLAASGEGLPFAAFAAACAGTFAASRRWPGQNPVTWAADLLSDLVRYLRGGRTAQPV